MTRLRTLSSFLYTLTFLFALRILGQFLEKIFNIKLLAAGIDWDSGFVNYFFLLGAQILILIGMLVLNSLLAENKIRQSHRFGLVCLIFGFAYFFLMAIRLYLCFSNVEDPWFKRPIPTIFHLVLATYILAFAFYHLNIYENFFKIFKQIVLNIRSLFIEILIWPWFVRAYKKPRLQQKQVLKKILKVNAQTNYGLKYKFREIKNYKDYRSNIPLNSYEDLRPYIEEQMTTDKRSLTHEKPFMYSLTSATTGKAKYIPILRAQLIYHRLYQNIGFYVLHKKIPRIFDGKIFGIVSPAIEGYLKSKQAFGSISGLIYKTQPWFLSREYVVPYEIFEIKDHELKYQEILRYAKLEPNISLMASPNPSTFFKIYEGIDESSKSFLDFWPKLKAIITWTCGNCASLIPKLKSIAPNVAIVEMGYLSTEFRGSVNIDPLRNLCAATIHENFYEFIKVSDYELNRSEYKLIDELEEGELYYVVVTTQNGLYRYFINDIIKARSNFQATPCIEFVQKGKGCTNITGEKLYEQQIEEVLITLHDNYGLTIDFYVMLAEPEERVYSFYYESPYNIEIEEIFEVELFKANLEFEAKRKSQRLKKTLFKKLKKGTFSSFKNYCLEQGQREGQFKYLKLQEKKDFNFPIEEYIDEN